MKELKDKLTTLKQRFDRGVSVQGLQMSGRALEESQGPRGQVRDTPMFVITSDEEKVLSSLVRKQPTRRVLRCFNNTRLGVRQEIDDWTNNLDVDNILLITGYPGVGKSTLASQMSYDLSKHPRLVVILGFDRTVDTDPEVIWSTFAYEIARKYSTCRTEIISTLDLPIFRHNNMTASEIFQRLIFEPLEKCKSTFEPGLFPVFILDALDECGGLDNSASDKRKKLLSDIREWSKLPREFKLIVTSRDEIDIRDEFETIPHKTLEIKTGSDVTEESTSDISLYIQDAFKRIKRKNRFRIPPLPTDWPEVEIEKELAERAGGVFIWAVTALEFIEQGGPVERLRTIQAGGLPGRGVHALYRQILETSFPEDTDSSKFVKLASAVIAAQKYLTVEDWARLLQMDEGIVKSIHGLLSTVIDADVVRFRHQSFVDFLLGSNDVTSNHSESGRPGRFRVDVSEGHYTLAQASFRLMNSSLRFNTCDIHSSYVPINRVSSDTCVSAIPPSLAYACELWEFHLKRLRPSYTIDTSLILRFLQEVSLYWIESLSVLGKLNVAVDALDVLHQYFASTNVSFRSDGVVSG